MQLGLPPAVRATDLVVAYDTKIAIATSTFTIPSGTVTAVIGPNGSGKSTLLNVIAGLIDRTSGEIDVPARRGGFERVSYVLQTTKVNDALPISVAEVVAMGRFAGKGWFERLGADDRAAISSAMDRTGVTDLQAEHLQRLSVGQRQRVFVAQGLAQEHELLLLDEPLSGIDLTAAHAIDKVIHDEIEKGCAVVMTTHDLSEAKVADHVILLAGRVVACGPPESVLTTENLTAAYGPSLLHIDGGNVFIDDPAHQPVPGRHIHRQKMVHPETSPGEYHQE
jgi:iron complex transport system ATP-binding protein